MRSLFPRADAPGAAPEPHAALQQLLAAVADAGPEDPESVQPVVDLLGQFIRDLGPQGEDATSGHVERRAAVDSAMRAVGSLLSDLERARDGVGRALASLNQRPRIELDASQRSSRLDVAG